MGTEIVFVLILPIAALCLLAAVLFWSRVAKIGWGARSGPSKAYVALFIGFAASMAGLALLTCIEGQTDFTNLIALGYYTEVERPIYLPGRVFAQMIVKLIFLLPAISFGVVPLTTWFIKKGRLTLKTVGLFAIIGWVALSFLGWAVNLAINNPPYSFLSIAESTALAVLIYGLPIPVAAIWLLPPRSKS